MSRVQICNRALSTYLGLGRITSLDEGSPAALQCNMHYNDTRRALLERHWWNFAKRRAVLAQLTNDRPLEWAAKYQMPSDSRGLHWVNDSNAARNLQAMRMSQDIDREVIGESIYCDVEAAVCQYTQDVTDEALFPQYFADALAASLAAAIAIPLTQSFDRARFAFQQADAALINAIAMDDRNTPPFEMALPEYLRDRGVT